MVRMAGATLPTWECMPYVSTTMLWAGTRNRHIGRRKLDAIRHDGRQRETRNRMRRLRSIPSALREKLSIWEAARAKGPLRGVSEIRGGWRKYPGNPILGAGLGVVFDACVLSDGGLFRMWLSWRDCGSIAYAESADGVAWSKPSVVLAPDDGHHVVNRPGVLHSASGYHMWYTQQTTTQSCVLYARSEDGLVWHRVGSDAVLAPTEVWEKQSVMCPHVAWEETSRIYRMWYSAGEQYEPRAIGYATSTDGVSWIKHRGNPVMRPCKSHPWEGSRVTGCHVTKCDSWYVMFYIGFHGIHRAQICLARSRDGIHDWERHPCNPIVSPSRDGWDCNAVYKPCALRCEGRWMLWYNGRRGQSEQIGLAQLDGPNLGF